MRIPFTLPAALLAFFASAQTTYDARIDDYKGLKFACDGSVTPVLRIQNMGSATMSTCVVETWKNGVVENTFNWILAIPAVTGAFRQPAFPAIPVVPGDEIELRIISVNTNPDEDPVGNIRTETIEAEPSPGASYTVNVEVKTDDFPGETTWEMRNDLGVVVAQGGPYAEPNGEERSTVGLAPSDCYTFEVKDSGGDGMSAGARSPGYVRVSSLGTELIEIDGGAFTDRSDEGLRTGSDACALTQLTTSAAPEISCGVDVWMVGGSTIYAVPVPTANKYQWRFTRGSYVRTIAKPTNALPITKWATLPLKPGRIYSVDVRCSYDNGATWCPFGPVCSIRTRNGAQPNFRSSHNVDETVARSEMLLWPVPNDGSGFHLLLDAEEGTNGPAVLTVIDMAGREVASDVFTIPEGEVPYEVRFAQPLNAGLYVVRVSIDGATMYSRLVIR
ncbi:MAG: T9SS type A sorting domain-containing protein [Flavobacteriales bacterium]